MTVMEGPFVWRGKELARSTDWIAAARAAAEGARRRGAGRPRRGVARSRRAGPVAIVGSVLMPVELRGGTPADGLAWMRAALAELRDTVLPGSWFYDVEMLAAPWARGGPSDQRPFTLTETTGEFARVGFSAIECAYRFRDRVILKGAAGITAAADFNS